MKLTLSTKARRSASSISFNLNRFDLLSIRLAVACAQRGSLTAAARESNIALAAASRRIKELEAGLGVPLFDRRPTGLVHTSATAAFLKHAWEMLDALHDLESELSDLRNGISRHIKICASSAAISQFLPPLLASWEKKHPEIHVDIEEQVSAVVLTRVLERRAEVGVFIKGPATQGLRTWPFREDELVVVFSKAHKLAQTDPKGLLDFDSLLDEYWISLGTGAAMLRDQQQAAILQDKPLKIRMHLRSFDSICHMVEANLGIALLPKTSVLPVLKTMKLAWRKLNNSWSKRQMLLATSSGQTAAEVQLLIDFLRQPAAR